MNIAKHHETLINFDVAKYYVQLYSWLHGRCAIFLFFVCNQYVCHATNTNESGEAQTHMYEMRIQKLFRGTCARNHVFKMERN